ncbi:hypothetical protein BGZ82_000361, partial [Podila clonocystis]
MGLDTGTDMWEGLEDYDASGQGFILKKVDRWVVVGYAIKPLELVLDEDSSSSSSSSSSSRHVEKPEIVAR